MLRVNSSMMNIFDPLEEHEYYMRRCTGLATLALGNVAPNPLVGAVLVHDHRIIGEGWHHKFGDAHAEVNCISSVKKEDLHLVEQSTLYVSLEPCAHYGKTPPCTDLILRNRIRKVVVGCRDPFPQVAGKGIQLLKNNNVEVIEGILEEECKWINRRFFQFTINKRPYIILKWAQTADGFLAGLPDTGRLMITGQPTQRLVHKWRSEEAGIMTGTNTILSDDPELNTREWNGPSPVRIVIDKKLRLPAASKVFSKKGRVIIFNHVKNEEQENILYRKLDESDDISAMLNSLYLLSIQSILVEGGAVLIKSFIKSELWDEARVLVNPFLTISKGVPAPVLQDAQLTDSFRSGNDNISIYRRSSHG